MRPSASTVPSAIPWETLRETYTTRFGPLTYVHPVMHDGEPHPHVYEDVGGDPIIEPVLLSEEEADERSQAAELIHYELSFGSASRLDSRTTDATFGAARRTGGHEAFITSIGPFKPFEGLLGDLVMHHGPLSPGMVVSMRAREAPYDAVLLALPDAGSISLGNIDGRERFALRVIPLTPAESKLAADSVDHLVAALRNAGVLDAIDPMRDCVLAPLKTQQYWIHVRPIVLDQTRRRLRRAEERLQRLVDLNAPDSFIQNEEALVRDTKLLLQYIESKQPEPSSPAGRHYMRATQAEELFRKAFEGAIEFIKAGGVPRPLIGPCAQVIGIALLTHPVAMQLIASAMDGDREPAASRFDVDELLARVAKWVGPYYPDSDPATLLAAGRAGLTEAKEVATGADGFVPPNLAWCFVVRAMFVPLEDRSTLVGTATAQAIRDGVDVANLALLREDARDPIERLRQAGKLIAIRMSMTWLCVQGFDAADPNSKKKAPRKQKGAKQRSRRRMKTKH